MSEFLASWRRATCAELAWLDGAGAPAAVSAVPLVDGDVPCVALTYDRRDRVAAPGATVAFAVTDSRSLPPGQGGVAAIGPVSVTERSEALDEDLLDQELRKFPPSRLLADSLLVRRENWWYLARIVVRLERVDRVLPLPARGDAGRDALLVRDDGAGLRLDVAAGDWDRPDVALRAGVELRGDGGPVLAHGHDFSPDRERWESWTVRGQLRGDRLHVTGRDGRRGTDPRPPGLLERLRRSRALERGCRRGIAAAEADAG